MESVSVRGVQIPALGFGSARLTGEACRDAVAHALELGYRHIDTAQMYDNEAADGFVVETINADAAGDDRQNLNDEYIVFSNVGDEALDLSGWTVRDDLGKTYTFPDDFVLAAGASVRLHTGSGTDTQTDLYWGASQPVWNNDGDTVIVETGTGETVIREAY